MTSAKPLMLSLNAMATRFEIVLGGAEASRLRAAGEEALEEIASLDRQLSFYNPDSDVSRINARAGREPVRIEPRLFQLLQTASDLSRATDGAFDITVAPLMRAWGLAGGEGSVPSECEIEEAGLRVGAELVHLDEERCAVSFERDGVQIDLGAIGKGYAIDRAVETLRDNGVTSALIHGGTSTIYALGTAPDGRPWRVAIRYPRRETEPALGRDPLMLGCDLESHPEQNRELDLHDCSLSVSAIHGKSFMRDGREYGHVIDPRCGLPTQAAALAAVWGPSATVTDALSTALLVLGEPGVGLLCDGYQGLTLIDSRPDAG